MQHSLTYLDNDNEEMFMKMMKAATEQPHVDLGIFGNFWLQKPHQALFREDLETSASEEIDRTERPEPVFRKEEFLDKFPELRH